MLTEPHRNVRAGRAYLSLLRALSCRVRATVGVSFRWVFLLPPSLLQPRVSPMGCNGIRYSMNMQPKKRNGVLPGKERAPSVGPVLLTSAGRGEKNNQKVKNVIFSTAGGANCLFNFYFLPLASSGKKSIHELSFARDGEIESEDERAS